MILEGVEPLSLGPSLCQMMSHAWHFRARGGTVQWLQVRVCLDPGPATL